MIRTLRTVCLVLPLLAAQTALAGYPAPHAPVRATPPAPGPHPGWGDGYPFGLGFGWTNKYYAVGGCPGNQQRPWNPLLGVPLYSSLGQTGPRRMLLWPPQVRSPLYTNTPRLVPYPPGQRPPCGVNCPY